MLLPEYAYPKVINEKIPIKDLSRLKFDDVSNIMYTNTPASTTRHRMILDNLKNCV